MIIKLSSKFWFYFKGFQSKDPEQREPTRPKDLKLNHRSFFDSSSFSLLYLLISPAAPASKASSARLSLYLAEFAIANSIS